MERTSENFCVNYDGAFEISSVLNQIKSVSREDTTAACETVIDNPQHVIIDKTIVIQTKAILKEKVIIPKNGIFESHCQQSNVQQSSSCSAYNISTQNVTQVEENDSPSQDLKMELGSQESTDIKMEISSQESVSSIMDICSPESSLDESLLCHSNNGIDGAFGKDDQLPGKSPKRNIIVAQTDKSLDEAREASLQLQEKPEKSLKRKLVAQTDESLDEAQEASLLLREKAVEIREKAVFSRENLVRIIENYSRDNIRNMKTKRTKTALS